MTKLFIAGAGRDFDLRAGEYSGLRQFAQLLLLLDIRAALLPCFASPSSLANRLLECTESGEHIIIVSKTPANKDGDVAKEAIRGGFAWPFYKNDALYGKLKEALIEEPVAEQLSQLPSGCRIIENRIGSTPGFSLKIKDSTVIVLPHKPAELFDMLDSQVLPMLARASGKSLARTVLTSENIDSSLLEPLLEKLLHEFLEEGKAPADFHISSGDENLTRITVTACSDSDAEAASLAEAYAAGAAKLLPDAVAVAVPDEAIPEQIPQKPCKTALAATGRELLDSLYTAIPFDNMADIQPPQVREKVFLVPSQYIEKDGGANRESAMRAASRIISIYGVDIGFCVIYADDFPQAAICACRGDWALDLLLQLPQDIPREHRLELVLQSSESLFRKALEAYPDKPDGAVRIEL